ncbi:NADH dehydrogenase [ubiquinone] 1 alpha subcomplex subunit 3 isoform X6 [Macaca thibetana thibetana]|uniref:NADH dehydrogenase [ubiquinone] 1 alpha subcomplex subunit 3 isoform X6 n=1 Tax=Macaca thibetana thibetana TaxID=257877 RepID=UPI0021BCD4DA|nr:NADH dehydrogenase [ubiquinone] 1 alpha subcomplex subunit 3 isoform X6 [Macaca thibetana thibetana]
MPGTRSQCWSRPSSSGASSHLPLGLTPVSLHSYNYAHIQPLRQVLHHDQRGHALQLPRTLETCWSQWPTSCPTVPVRDDGNMPDVPSHPQDPQGPSLEWLKKL